MRPPTALVTGGTGGVGAEVCTLLAEAGYRLAYTYRSNHEASRALTDRIGRDYGEAPISAAVDLADTPECTRVLQGLVEGLGGLDVVVHASGPLIPQRYLSSIDADLFMKHVRDEYLAFFNVVQAVLPSLRERSGSLVAVTTMAVRAYPVRDALSASPKAGVEALVKAVAAEEGRYGVRANCVGPGILADGIGGAIINNGDFPEPAQEFALKRLPLRRFGRAKEVAEAVAFLASPRAGYITGQCLDVDGGFSL